jgi:hypothetical protein
VRTTCSSLGTERFVPGVGRSDLPTLVLLLLWFVALEIGASPLVRLRLVQEIGVRPEGS